MMPFRIHILILTALSACLLGAPFVIAADRAVANGPPSTPPTAATAPSAATTPASSPAPAAKKPDEPKLTVLPALGNETVSFSKDIAPVLVDNCFGCHSGPQPRARFQMARFTDLIRGGLTGNPWVPFQPADSLLIKKLNGTAGKRMPQPDKRGPLPAETIAKFEKWISEGARFDGPDPKGSIQMLAALTRAKNASPSDLAADRLTAAKRMWRLTNPTDKPNFKETKNLLVVSNLPAAQLQDVAQVAEQQVVAIAKQFHAPADQPLVKGGITLFVFPTRYDYSEFGLMVENRTLPRDWRGHWKFNTIDAYVAIIPPADPADYSLAGILQQQLAAVYIASLSGKPPEWFADATGRAMAARVDAKSIRVRDWNERLKQLADLGKLDKFVDHGLAPSDNEIAAYGFVKELIASPAKFSQLISSLRDGEALENALPQAYGSPLQLLVTTWAKSSH